MNYNKYDIQKFQLYFKTIANTGSTLGYDFVHPDGSSHPYPYSDCLNNGTSSYEYEEPFGNNPSSEVNPRGNHSKYCAVGWLPVFLTRTYDHYEYVNTKKDEFIETLTRQDINPLFIEHTFFNNIQRVAINNGSELTSAMIEKLKEIQVIESYPLNRIGFVCTQGSRFYGLRNLVIGGERPPNIEPGITKVRLAGTPYDGTEWLIKEKWHDTNGNLGSVSVNSFPLHNAVQEVSGNPWRIERPENNNYTGARIEFIRFYSNPIDIKNWFDTVGKDMIFMNKKGQEELNLTELEKTTVNWFSTISKASFYPITIWK